MVLVIRCPPRSAFVRADRGHLVGDRNVPVQRHPRLDAALDESGIVAYARDRLAKLSDPNQ